MKDAEHSFICWRQLHHVGWPHFVAMSASQTVIFDGKNPPISFHQGHKKKKNMTKPMQVKWCDKIGFKYAIQQQRKQKKAKWKTNFIFGYTHQSHISRTDKQCKTTKKNSFNFSVGKLKMGFQISGLFPHKRESIIFWLIVVNILSCAYPYPYPFASLLIENSYMCVLW